MKRLIFVIASTLCIAFLEAQSVSKELATRIALQYLRSDISNAAPQEYSQLTMNTDVDTIYTSTFSSTGKAPLYLVQLSEGWVLVASEFVGIPILASSPIGQFPIIEDMPEGMKWLLSYYEDAMQFTRDSLSPNIDSIQYVWEHRYDSISNTNINRNNSSPLPSNHTIDSIGSFLWKQSRNNTSGIPNCDKVYNKFCPTWYNADSICYRTLVGCVAVAMGLVMRYNKWPHSARIPNTIDPLGNTSSGKHFVAYQWNRMPCTIGNSTDNMIVDEIAGFLRDCGYASKMKYGIDGSTAYLSNATDALNDIFRYE